MQLDARLTIAFHDQRVPTANHGDGDGGRVVRCHEIVDQRVDAARHGRGGLSLACKRVAREDKANDGSRDDPGDHDVEGRMIKSAITNASTVSHSCS